MLKALNLFQGQGDIFQGQHDKTGFNYPKRRKEIL